MSGADSSRTLVMYVASQPGLAENLVGAIPYSFGARLVSMFFPFGSLSYPQKVEKAQVAARSPARSQGETALPAGEEGPDELPSAAHQCVLLVLDVAKGFGWSVHVVDVTRQPVAEGEVLESLGGDVELPLLLRPDGARLEGDVQFTPHRVREFLSPTRSR